MLTHCCLGQTEEKKGWEVYYQVKTPWGIEIRTPTGVPEVPPPPPFATWTTPAMLGIPVVGWMGIAFILGVLVAK